MSLLRLFTFPIAFAALFGSEWPRFRGPNGSGVSPDRGLPAEIKRDRNMLWKTQTPKGHSSPIIVQDRVYITGHEGDERILLCYDGASGSLLWRTAVSKARTESPNPVNGFTTPTPATDGHSIFVYFPDIGLLAFDFGGKERWRAPLGPFGGI